jgi:hypothetical protein
MNPGRNFHPQVLDTGDGERSTAGSNYGDWRPLRPHGPHGYDFEARFRDGVKAPDDLYRQLREDHGRELDARYPDWRYQRFSEDFQRWREERAAAGPAPTGTTDGER